MSATDWHCQGCGSPRWVSASLTGPVGYGGRAIKQCVPCGRYSDDDVTDEDRRRKRELAVSGDQEGTAGV